MSLDNYTYETPRRKIEIDSILRRSKALKTGNDGLDDIMCLQPGTVNVVVADNSQFSTLGTLADELLHISEKKKLKVVWEEDELKDSETFFIEKPGGKADPSKPKARIAVFPEQQQRVDEADLIVFLFQVHKGLSECSVRHSAWVKGWSEFIRGKKPCVVVLYHDNFYGDKENLSVVELLRHVERGAYLDYGPLDNVAVLGAEHDTLPRGHGVPVRLFHLYPTVKGGDIQVGDDRAFLAKTGNYLA